MRNGLDSETQGNGPRPHWVAWLHAGAGTKRDNRRLGAAWCSCGSTWAGLGPLLLLTDLSRPTDASRPRFDRHCGPDIRFPCMKLVMGRREKGPGGSRSSRRPSGVPGSVIRRSKPILPPMPSPEDGRETGGRVSGWLAGSRKSKSLCFENRLLCVSLRCKTCLLHHAQLLQDTRRGRPSHFRVLLYPNLVRSSCMV